MTMLQVPEEIHALGKLLRSEGVKSYLEIGSKFGGSLRQIAEYLPVWSKVVAIDLPGGTKAWKESEASLKGVMRDLRLDGFETHLIWGNSTDPVTIERVRALAPFDAIFIDADHRLPGVTADWNNYGPMGTIIAFHDIAWRRAPEWVGTRIDVPEFWNSIKSDYQHKEFKFCPTGKNNGIGVLWRL